MPRFFNSNSVGQRDAQDSDSEMNYMTAESRRTSQTSGFDSGGRRRTAGVPEYHAPNYAEYRTSASMSPSSDAQSSPVYFDEPGPSRMPVLSFENGGSRESLATTDMSRQSDAYSEVDSATSPRTRGALHTLNTQPSDKIQHFTQLGEYVRELYLDRGLADVMIKIGDETFPTHRIALASQSAYFSNLFLNEVSNTRLKLPLEIRIKGIEPKAFQAFLTYIYTGELNVPPDVTSDFLYMCSKLRCQGILETWQQLLQNMTLEQALILVDKVQETGPLYTQALNILLRKFPELHKHKRYYELNPGTMCKLLMHDHLNVSSEVEAFEEAQRWLSKVVDPPRDTEVRLLRRIRYSLMKPKELFRVCQKSKVFKTDPVCKEMVLRANWLHTQQQLGLEDGIKVTGAKPRTKMPADSGKSKKSPSPGSESTASNQVETSPTGNPKDMDDFPVPRVGGMDGMCKAVDSDYSVDDDIIGDYAPFRRGHRAKVTVGPHSTRHCGGVDGFLTGDILAVGGSQRRNREHRSGRHVQRYSSEKNRWMQFAPLPEHRQNHAVAIFGGKLYLTGGCETDGSRQLATRACNRVFVFDTEETVWQEVAPMCSKRRCHALCPLFGKLYALGGQDEWGRVLNSVERYNPHDNSWEFVTPMRHARLGAGAAVFRGFLFVVGGYGEEGSIRRGLPILGVVECFDPRIHKWTLKHPMRIPRCYCNLVCCNQRLYVFGGAAEIHGMLQSVGSVDLYDPRNDEWEHVANLHTPRHNSGSAVIGNKIYIIGGVCSKEHNQVLQSIECYNAGTGSWEAGVEPLPHPAKSVGCAVLPVVTK